MQFNFDLSGTILKKKCEAASARRAKALRPEGPKNENRVGSGSAVSSPAESKAQPQCSFCLQEKFGQQDTRRAIVSRPDTTLLGVIIIIIIERKDLGGVMSKDCKDTLQTLKYSTMSVQCQFPQWGPRQSPGGKRILAHF